jgi:hypothetical protein
LINSASGLRSRSGRDRGRLGWGILRGHRRFSNLRNNGRNNLNLGFRGDGLKI